MRIHTLLFIIILFVSMMLCTPCYAAGTEAQPAAVQGWFTEFLCMVEQTLWIAILSLAGWAIKKSMDKNNASEEMAQIFDALTQGVDEIYESTVRELKARSADGKLSGDDRIRVMDMAKDAALKKLSGPTRDALAKWGAQKVYSAIKAIVEKKKAATAKVNAVIITPEANHASNTPVNGSAAAAAADSNVPAQSSPIPEE
ncbi:MAG TPA: hypothetical protein PKB02_02490 [Anaerohalosphaeraceae bacterium]|nr:hypothetical protein [Anaerohalosphaeraceae bacterium]